MLKSKTAQQIIDILGKQRDILVEVDEQIRLYNDNKLMDADNFEDLIKEYMLNNKNITDKIKRILFSLREQ